MEKRQGQVLNHSNLGIPEHLLRVDVQMCPIDLVESPVNVLDGSGRVVAAGIIGEVVAEG